MKKKGNKRVVILGAGLTGLVAAHFIGRIKEKPFILEKKSVAGGLCRTEEKDGFLFDRTGHLLHFKDEKSRWKNFIINEMKVPLKEHRRRAYIHILGRLIPYPFQYHLSFLPADEKKKCVVDFLKASKTYKMPSSGAEERRNFYDWARQSFGERMFRLFFLPYNNKLWKYSLKKMSTLWMGRFVPLPSLEKIIRGAENRDPSQNAGYNASFYYPSNGGIGTLVESLAKEKNIIFNSDISLIDHAEKNIYFEGGNIAYDILISTIPLPVLLGYFKKSPIMELADKLKWTGVYNVNLVIKKDFSKLGHWIYFPHGKIPFYRIGFFSNFSPVPENYSSVYVETSYTGRAGKPKLASILKFLKLDEEKIHIQKNFDIPFAYVIYDKNRELLLPEIFDFFKNNGIISTGRFGGWKYSTMEEAMQDGFDAAEFALK